MKHLNWQVRLGLLLIALSAALYLVHYLLFRDAFHIAFYLVADVAFIPVEVFLVTVVIHHLLARRAKRAMLRKLNMVVGAFFSEAGTPLLRSLVRFDASADATASKLLVSPVWTVGQFRSARKHFREHDHNVEAAAGDLEGLRGLLLDKREFLLRLLENPNLLEHDRFTELLWAVFHLTEELACRPDLTNLPATDLKHLSGDIRRAYGLVVAEWLAYMEHLQADYPYLFSLAVRTNPFDRNASPIVS